MKRSNDRRRASDSPPDRLTGRQGKRFQVTLDCEFLDEDAVGSLMDEICARLLRRLEISQREWRPVRVFIREGASWTEDREIHVSPRRESGGLSSHDWFELLFAHELSHLLIANDWGMAPVLFWEGVPIYLADNHVRERILGNTYHEYCRALLELGDLLAMDELLLAARYYARRTDSRVDIQSGSFCGFLLETYGIAAIRGVFRDYQAPSIESPRLVLNPLMERYFGADFPALTDDWIQFLKRTVRLEAPLVSRLRDKKPVAAPTTTPRCNFCRNLVQPATAACSSCGATADTEIEIV